MPKMKTFFKNLCRQLIYGGTSSLNRYETLILDAVQKSLPDFDGEAFSDQMKSSKRIQRTSGGRMVQIFFKDKEAVKKLSCLEEAKQIAVTKYRVGGVTGNASVVVHRGFLSSIEFSGSKAFKQLSGRDTSLEIIKVSHPTGGSRLSEALDRLEHDKGDQ